MQSPLDDLRLLNASQGYATLGLYIESNKALEKMGAETRLWPEVLAVKLEIFNGLKLWDMVEVTALLLRDSAKGNMRWLSMAESACKETRVGRLRERLFAREVGVAMAGLL